MGWVDGYKAFVLGNGATIGDQSYVFQPAGAITRNARGMQPRGTVEDWRDGVAALCRGNPVMTMAVSAAFAGPLLDIVGAEGGGVHLRGGSSSGKTTALKAAASVWGDPDAMTMSWRATSNGIEAIAAAANSTLLVLDEIGMVKGSEAGQTAYMIANGQGKHRADRTGDAREAKTWRTMFLSSGEQDLESKMNEDGLKRRAGQEVRLIDFVADNYRFGVFDDAARLAGRRRLRRPHQGRGFRRARHRRAAAGRAADRRHRRQPARRPRRSWRHSPTRRPPRWARRRLAGAARDAAVRRDRRRRRDWRPGSASPAGGRAPPARRRWPC